MNQKWGKCLDLRREAAKAKNKNRWTISNTPGRNNEYSKVVDKDGLLATDRKTIEAVKDRNTYPAEEGDLWP